MAGYIVILYLAIAVYKGRPIKFLAPLGEPQHRSEVVEEHITEEFLVRHGINHWLYIGLAEIVLQFLVVQADFEPVKSFGLAVEVEDIAFIGVLLNLCFLVVGLYGDAVLLVADGLFLLDGDGGVFQSVKARGVLETDPLQHLFSVFDGLAVDDGCNGLIPNHPFD